MAAWWERASDQLQSLNQDKGCHNNGGGGSWSRSKISLLAIGIDFMCRSHRSGPDLRWSRQIENRGGLFQPLNLFCSFSGFRPQAKGELEECPRVNGQLSSHFLAGCVPGC